MQTASVGVIDQVIDTMSPAWFTGTGYSNAPNGTGNDDYYMGPDTAHPTQAGHDYLAQRVAAEITRGLAA